MSIMFLTTPVIMAFHAGLREQEGFMPAILISGPSWIPAEGYSCIAECNADFANRIFVILAKSQTEPGVLKLAI